MKTVIDGKALYVPCPECGSIMNYLCDVEDGFRYECKDCELDMIVKESDMEKYSSYESLSSWLLNDIEDSGDNFQDLEDDFPEKHNEEEWFGI